MGSYVTVTSAHLWIAGFFKGGTASSDTLGSAIFTEAISDAEALVNSAIGVRYSLPITPVPPILATISKNIACYYAIQRAFTQEGGGRENVYLKEFEKAGKLLEQLQAGTSNLQYTDGSLVPLLTQSNICLSNTKDFAPTANLDSEENWELDPDRATEISDERK